jgi:hypothetical protein
MQSIDELIEKETARRSALVNIGRKAGVVPAEKPSVPRPTYKPKPKPKTAPKPKPRTSSYRRGSLSVDTYES